MARIVQNFGHRARIRGSDLFDHYHYSSAVYAILIVSDDADLTRSVKIIDDKPIKTVRGASDFAAPGPVRSRCRSQRPGVTTPILRLLGRTHPQSQALPR